MDKPTILLADDDADVRETTCFGLKAEGFHVVTAVDGLEALRTARDIEPDLIVLDVMMPKANGYRVSSMLKDDQAKGCVSKTIPILLLTARNLSGDPQREKSFLEFSKADHMMYKPFEMDELVALIRELLGRVAAVAS